jgi:hypothetical protein
MKKYSPIRLDQRGFTLPELISVMVVTMIFTGLIMFFMFEYWRGSATLQNDLQSYVGRLNAGDKLRDYLNATSGLITQNSIPDSHTNNPDPSISGNSYWVPLHAVPGNFPVGTTGTTTPLIYFRQPVLDSSKNFIMNGTLPYENEYVLYLDGTRQQLLIRTLANGAASGNAAKTSCPPAAASATCPADKIIGENISSVDTRYFSRAGNTINYQSITDPNSSPPGAFIGPDFTAVEVVELNLHTFIKSTLHGGQDTSSQTIIRVALRNG